MADESSTRGMSLVPYVPEQSREIVLRHESTVVVYDQRSKQLSLRDASGSSGSSVDHSRCPTCHRPFEEESPHHERQDVPSTSYMDPSYFRMLQASTDSPSETSTPRRLSEPAEPQSESPLRPPPGAEFVASEPRVSAHGISASAFSSNYFKTFFVEEKELGRGGKGVVLLVTHVLDGVSLGQFACKRVPVGDDHAWLEKVLVEVRILQNLSHQNLVSYRHVWLEDYKINTFGPSVPCAFILQQYCNGGDLQNYVVDPARVSVTKQQLKERMRRRSKGQLDEPSLHEHRRMQFEDIFSFFKDITSGLHHLHSHGYVHRDLKPSNCLLHYTGQKIRVLVSDFGEVQGVNIARKSTGATGTIAYCAPEVLRRDSSGRTFGNFTVKSDIFSLGMIVYFMCFGKLPYSSADDINAEREDLDQLREEIASWAGFDGNLDARSDLPDIYKFLRRLLSIDPNDRPTTAEILTGIRAGQGLENHDDTLHPSILDDRRTSRISNADSPSPAPRRHFLRKDNHGSKPLLRPPHKLATSTSSEDRRSPSPPKSPPRQPSEKAMAQEAEEASAVIRSTASRNETQSNGSGLESPRLALPPPPSRPSLFLGIPMQRGLKVLFFLIKYLSVTTPCQPYLSNPLTTYPLLFLATIDFMLPAGENEPQRQTSMKRSIGLMLLHTALLWIANITGFLCHGSRNYDIFFSMGREPG